MIVFDNVSKKYSKNEILKGITFSVDAGETLILTGPNGSGKSTLLNILAGQIIPTSGTVAFYGKPILRNTDYKLRTGFYLDQTDLIHELSGFDFLKLKTLAYGIKFFPEQFANNLTDELFDNRLDLFRPIEQYSKGMKAKLSIISNLILSPELIVLDEPCSGLDFESVLKVIKILKNEQREKRTSLIISTHNLQVIRSFPENIIFLKGGKIETKGNLDEAILQRWIGKNGFKLK